VKLPDPLVCCLNDKTVAELRPRPTSESPKLDTPKREGRDGRLRPVDPSAQRDGRFYCRECSWSAERPVPGQLALFEEPARA
jgi:hypothetical protein